MVMVAKDDTDSEDKISTSESKRKELSYSLFLFKKSPMFIFGTVLIVLIVILAIFAPIFHEIGVVPFLQNDRNTDQILAGPLTVDKRQYGYWVPTELFTYSSISNDIRLTTGSFYGNSQNDIIYGDDTGSLFISKNEGNQSELKYSSSDPILIQGQTDNLMTVGGGFAHPSVADLNGDSLHDLIVGANNGSIFFSINNGTITDPFWNPFEKLTFNNSEGNQVPINVESKAAPFLYKLDTDDDQDLVIGSGNGSLYFYENVGNLTHWCFSLIEDVPFNFAQGSYLRETNGFTSEIYPVFTHLSPDSKYETLVIVNSTNDLIFFSADSHGLDSKEYYEISSSIQQALPTEEELVNLQGIAFLLLNDDEYKDILYVDSEGTFYEVIQEFKTDNRLHLFGIDFYGGDVFSRCIWALQTDLVMAIWIVGAAVLIGGALGSIAGYFGGIIDTFTMRITDVFYAFPSLILAMAIASVLGRSMFNLGIALIVVWWTGYTRLIRAQVLLEREKAYVEAARAQGFNNMRILIRHILPNSWYPVLVNATLDLGTVILSLAGLSFIGFGAPLGSAELGRMIADGRLHFLEHPWITFFPGIFIFITVLGWNLVGDGLRDILDPQLRR